MEYYYLHNIPNAIFIGMLVFATIGVAIWSKKVIILFRDNIEMYINIYMGESSDTIKSIQTNNYNYIVNEALPTIVGCIYSILFAITIYHLDFWQDDKQIKLWFSLYLGYMNFITGVGLVLVYKVIKVIMEESKKIKFQGYIFENKSTRGFKRIKFKILVILLVYEMFSLTGTLFSSIDSKLIIALYSIFAIGFSISVYLLPEKAMKQSFQTVMDDAIDNLNNKIWGEYNLMMKNSESKAENLDFSKVLSLIEMKEKLIELGKNRNRVQKIYEVIILLILVVIPVVVQVILEKL
jgi:membrane protein